MHGHASDLIAENTEKPKETRAFPPDKARRSRLDDRKDADPVQLIIATECFENVPLRRIPGGYEAVLAGKALKRLIDATFEGASIEVLGGATTTITLMSSGARCVH